MNYRIKNDGQYFAVDASSGEVISPNMRSAKMVQAYMASLPEQPDAGVSLTIQPVAEDSAFLAVFDGGRQMSPATRDVRRAKVMLAERQRIARKASTADSLRPCVSCGDSFVSEGAHNRMCARCRATAGGVGNEFGHVSGGGKVQARRPLR